MAVYFLAITNLRQVCFPATISLAPLSEWWSDGVQVSPGYGDIYAFAFPGAAECGFIYEVHFAIYHFKW